VLDWKKIPQFLTSICEMKNPVIDRKSVWNLYWFGGSLVPSDRAKPESSKAREPLQYLGFVSISESWWDSVFLQYCLRFSNLCLMFLQYCMRFLELCCRFLTVVNSFGCVSNSCVHGVRMCFSWNFNTFKCVPDSYIGPFRKHYFNYCEGSLIMARMESRNI